MEIEPFGKTPNHVLTCYPAPKGMGKKLPGKADPRDFCCMENGRDIIFFVRRRPGVGVDKIPTLAEYNDDLEGDRF